MNLSSSGKKCIKTCRSFSLAWQRFRRLLLKRERSGKNENRSLSSDVISLYPAHSLSFPMSSNSQEIVSISLSGQRLFGPGHRASASGK